MKSRALPEKIPQIALRQEQLVGEIGDNPIRGHSVLHEETERICRTPQPARRDRGKAHFLRRGAFPDDLVESLLGHAEILSENDRGDMMSFGEIGAALGMSRQSAFNTYSRAIRRLRKMPVDLANLRELADELEKKRLIAVEWFGADDEEQRA